MRRFRARLVARGALDHDDSVGREHARERFVAEQERITMSGGGMIDQGVWRQGREELERAGRRIQARLGDIAELGGVPKDLGMGLVDFPHWRDGEVVNLCWKHGERSITHWHGLDEGYASRRPL